MQLTRVRDQRGRSSCSSDDVLSHGAFLHDMTYCLRTFGCQMNKHDSERVSGMLEILGALLVEDPEDADIVVFLTCCVREAADIRLLGQVASLKNTPAPHGRRLIAVGGCIGQRDGRKLVDQLPHIDIVLGTHNIARLPYLIHEALETETTQVEVVAESTDFATDLPTHREHAWHAWVPIMTGCNNFCTYCIVPHVRGREKSRPFEDIVAEAEKLVEEGVKEITLLGQNVNSYGRDLYGAPRFDEVLRGVGAVGVERLRFATSHPKDLSDGTIAAFAEVDAVMPQLHLPVQSGSDRILSAMNRGYTVARYRELVQKVQSAAGDVALSTDIMVGFPGETQEDFDQTLKLVQEVGYAQAFTFIYSKRAGTPAAVMDDGTPRAVIHERFEALVDAVQIGAGTQNQKEQGAVVRVLIEGTSKRDPSVLSGRSPKNQTVHLPLPAGVSAHALAGTFVDVRIDEARTWYLRGSAV